jgi:hypothetical protein
VAEAVAALTVLHLELVLMVLAVQAVVELVALLVKP